MAPLGEHIHDVIHGRAGGDGVGSRLEFLQDSPPSSESVEESWTGDEIFLPEAVVDSGKALPRFNGQFPSGA